jgi:hypothetical protein
MKLSEQTHSGPEKVDRENGVIKGVKILGFDSLNGRRYSESAVRSAVHLYEGKGVNVDHWRKSDDRPVKDHFGELRNVRFIEGKGLFGDLHYLKSHPEAETILERAERMPNQFGLSHVAEGETTHKGGVVVVESITAVESVDIVSRPATNKSMFESQEPVAMKIKIRKLLESKSTSPVAKLLREMAGDDEQIMEMDVPVEDAAAPEDQLKSGLMAAIVSKLESADAASLKKVLNVLGIGDSLSNAIGGEPAAESEEEEKVEESDDEKKVEESVQRRVAQLEAKADLLESGREAKPTWIKSAAALSGRERKEFIESLPKKGGQRPVTSPGKFKESQGGDSEFEQATANGMKLY